MTAEKGHVVPLSPYISTMASKAFPSGKKTKNRGVGLLNFVLLGAIDGINNEKIDDTRV